MHVMIAKRHTQLSIDNMSRFWIASPPGSRSMGPWLQSGGWMCSNGRIALPYSNSNETCLESFLEATGVSSSQWHLTRAKSTMLTAADHFLMRVPIKRCVRER